MSAAMITNENIASLAVVVVGVCAIEEANKRKRRWWERPHLGVNQRSVYGQYELLQQMRISDEESFASILRFRPDSFDKLLTLVGPLITHYSNREPINPSTRLAVTLRYLATGESFKSLSYTYRLGKSTTGEIIAETLAAIYNALRPTMLPDLDTEKWLKIADGFNSRWNVPNSCGPVDGKHIRIKKPEHSGSEFFNYKGFFSVVMMGVADPGYRFLAVDVGCQGRNNDAVVLNNSKFGQKLLNGTLNLPGEREIKHGPKIPHYLLGDEMFGLQPYLMVPYPGRGTGKLTYTQKTFNYRHSRARRIIECTFGIFTQVFGIFLTSINAPPETVDLIVMAAVCLHNFRISENESGDLQENGFYDGGMRSGMESVFEAPGPNAPIPRSPQAIRDELASYFQDQGTTPPFDNTDSLTRARSIRDELAEYFTTGGRVHWQDQFIH
ncbi:protein ALP1-like [Bradysia coprophila]|uniref:protein ALP1-like n=1 Tax=Bradysia coprophila TaxID=38358 RepID=UPI00187D9885|nr:protein ALP1-like [Bradysia coprophila]